MKANIKRSTMKTGKIVLMLPTIALLTSCDVIGDVSETVGGFVTQGIQMVGGGTPLAKDDGGSTVSKYLDDFTFNSRMKCEDINDDLKSYVDSLDGERPSEEKRKEFDKRFKQLEVGLWKKMSRLPFSMELSLSNEQSKSFKTSSVTLEKCKYNRMSNCFPSGLTCEGVAVISPKIKEEIQLYSLNDSGNLFCLRKDGKTYDENFVEWSEALSKANGFARQYSSGLNMSVRNDVDWPAPEEKEPESKPVKGGDTVRVQVSGLDGCLHGGGTSLQFNNPFSEASPDKVVPSLSVMEECKDGTLTLKLGIGSSDDTPNFSSIEYVASKQDDDGETSLVTHTTLLNSDIVCAKKDDSNSTLTCDPIELTKAELGGDCSDPKFRSNLSIVVRNNSGVYSNVAAVY